MPKAFLLLVLTALLCSDLLTGQDVPADSLDVVQQPGLAGRQFSDSLQQIDTSKAAPARGRQRVVLSPFYLDADRNISEHSAGEAASQVRRMELKYVNYHGVSDILKNQADFQLYDLMDMGLPRFISGLNLLPHQSSLLMDGFYLNDPTHGMYNMRFVSPEAINLLQRNSTKVAVLADNDGLLPALNIQPSDIVNEDPYTRIMFRQGDFGFSELDIDFAQKINSRLSLQLGGINKYYDPNFYHGVNYRASVMYQYSKNVFFRGRFNRNSESVHLLNASSGSAYQHVKYREVRDGLYGQLFMKTEKPRAAYWLVTAALSRTRRKNEMINEDFYLRHRFDRYSLAVQRSRQLQSAKLVAGGSLYQYPVWGTAYNKKYVDSGLNVFGLLEYSVQDSMRLSGVLRAHYRYGYDPLIAPMLKYLWTGKKSGISVRYDWNSRYPFKNESDFQFQGYSGSKSLRTEHIQNIALDMYYKPLPFIKLNGKIAHQRLSNEIRFDGSRFFNGGERNFSYISGTVSARSGWFVISAGGQLSETGTPVSPKASGWSEVRYHDTWLNGAITIDAVGAWRWYGPHRTVIYNPVVERFYWDNSSTDGYSILNYKLMATVKDAQLYMAMDNALSSRYRFVRGYYEFYRRVRFGVNWLLWD